MNNLVIFLLGSWVTMAFGLPASDEPTEPTRNEQTEPNWVEPTDPTWNKPSELLRDVPSEIDLKVTGMPINDTDFLNSKVFPEMRATECQNIQSDGNCQNWAGKGYCTRTWVEYMATNCMKSCNKCSTASECDYSSTFGSGHTMNLADKDSCTPNDYVVSEKDIKNILHTHNSLRAQVAVGKETLGCPGPQPSATNMKELKWNSQLAEVAQAWAEQCPGRHDDGDDRKICDPDYRVGQSIFFSWGYDAAEAWTEAINYFYDEVKDMPSTLVNSYGSNTCSTGGVIGHYTQVVWAETYQVGCGAIHYPATRGGKTYPESKIYVCNYGGSGNFIDYPVYESGATASNCPNGVSADYPELCA